MGTIGSSPNHEPTRHHYLGLHMPQEIRLIPGSDRVLTPELRELTPKEYL